MRKLLVIFLMIPFLSFGQETLDRSLNIKSKKDIKKEIKKVFKYATFYGAINGGNSVSDVDIYSVTSGLETSTIKTPFD